MGNMRKADFSDALRNGLIGLPQEDIEERVSFYGEMIDDRMEEGLTEEEAVDGIGPVDQIISQIASEIPLAKLVREKIKPKRSLRAWETVLIILGFPVWFPLLIAAGAVLLSLYIVLWSMIISLWAVEVSLWASALAGIAAAVVLWIRGTIVSGLAMFGAGLFLAGLSIFLFIGCLAATKGLARLTKKILLGIKKRFIRKEKAE
jgi:uncharacterized membrane protein